MNVQITLYHDTRRSKKHNTYPIKLRVWDSTTKKAKLYHTGQDMTEVDFNKAWLSQKAPKSLQEDRVALNAIISNAEKVAAKADPFSFDDFEKRLYRKAGEGIRVFYHYDEYIKLLKEQKRLSTADSYGHSKQAIDEYVVHLSKAEPANLSFYDITPLWLADFEDYMVSTLGRSITTVGIYLRNLRAMFNKAIRENEIDPKVYPFGKGKYQIPAARKKKKALSVDQLRMLWDAVPDNKEQRKAKDFWFFSYSMNGINLKDMAQLRYKQIKGDEVTFIRAKTYHTSKGDLKPITAYLQEFSVEVIQTYGNESKTPEDLVFDIISDSNTDEENHVKIKNFIRLLNLHLQRLCKSIGLPEEVSFYWARHSFATNAIRKGASMEFIQESLGHNDMKTTENYFAGFDDETKREFGKKMMEFDQ